MGTLLLIAISDSHSVLCPIPASRFMRKQPHLSPRGRCRRRDSEVQNTKQKICHMLRLARNGVNQNVTFLEISSPSPGGLRRLKQSDMTADALRARFQADSTNNRRRSEAGSRDEGPRPSKCNRAGL